METIKIFFQWLFLYYGSYSNSIMAFSYGSFLVDRKTNMNSTDYFYNNNKPPDIEFFRLKYYIRYKKAGVGNGVIHHLENNIHNLKKLKTYAPMWKTSSFCRLNPNWLEDTIKREEYYLNIIKSK